MFFNISSALTFATKQKNERVSLFSPKKSLDHLHQFNGGRSTFYFIVNNAKEQLLSRKKENCVRKQIYRRVFTLHQTRVRFGKSE